MKFEDFEQDALAMTENIYSSLQIPGWNEAHTAIEQYVNAKKGYKKNKYAYKPETVCLVNENWGRAIDDWGYERQ